MADYRKKDLKALLVQSVEAFNEFRLENPGVTIELSNMRFNDLDLSGVNLSNAGLGMCRFVGTKLEGANLTGARLNSARLNFAILKGANLDGAHVSRADFSNADLRGATLRNMEDCLDCKFHSADLRGASFEGTPINDQMVYKAKFDSTAFTSALTGDKQKESRRQFLMGVLGVLILFILLPLAGIYIYFKSMEKDGVKAEFAIQSKLLYYRGMFTLPKADYISAEFQFREAYRLNPKDTKCLVGLGDAYMGQMRFKAALETYKKGVMEAKDPKAIELLQDRLNNFSIRKKELEKKGGTE